MGEKEGPKSKTNGEAPKVDGAAALRVAAEIARIRAMAGTMQPGEREAIDVPGAVPNIPAYAQAAFNFDQLPQLEVEMEIGFRRAVGALADNLKAHPQGIRVPENMLRVLEEVCEWKGTRLPTFLTLLLNQAVLQYGNTFRILGEEEALRMLARKR